MGARWSRRKVPICARLTALLELHHFLTSLNMFQTRESIVSAGSREAQMCRAMGRSRLCEFFKDNTAVVRFLPMYLPRNL